MRSMTPLLFSRAVLTASAALAFAVLSACSGKEAPQADAPQPPASTPSQGQGAESAGEAGIGGERPANEAGADEVPADQLALIQSLSITALMDLATQDANDMADVLSAVNDEASARAAMADMRALGPKLAAMAARIDDGLEAGDVTLSLKTMNKISGLAKAQFRMLDEMGRIAKEHPELREIINDEFQDVEIKFE